MATLTTTPRHRATRRAPLRAMAIVTSAVAGATLLALGATGATLATWSDSAPISGGTVLVGNLTLLADTESAIQLSQFANMLPGDRLIQNVQLTTTGNVSTDVTVRNSAAAGPHQIRVAPNSCPSSPLAGSPLGSNAIGLGGWTPGQTKTVCVEVTLPANAPSSAQGATTSFSLSFLATQKAS